MVATHARKVGKFKDLLSLLSLVVHAHEVLAEVLARGVASGSNVVGVHLLVPHTNDDALLGHDHAHTALGLQ